MIFDEIEEDIGVKDVSYNFKYKQVEDILYTYSWKLKYYEYSLIVATDYDEVAVFCAELDADNITKLYVDTFLSDYLYYDEYKKELRPVVCDMLAEDIYNYFLHLDDEGAEYKPDILEIIRSYPIPNYNPLEKDKIEGFEIPVNYKLFGIYSVVKEPNSDNEMEDWSNEGLNDFYEGNDEMYLGLD